MDEELLQKLTTYLFLPVIAVVAFLQVCRLHFVRKPWSIYLINDIRYRWNILEAFISAVEEPLDCLVGVFQVWGQNQDSYLKKSLHIRWDFSSSRQLESTLFNTSLGVTAAVTGKLIIWKINDHIVTDLFVSGIFGPLACSFLIASALQEPSSGSRQFWSQTWKKLISQKVFF